MWNSLFLVYFVFLAKSVSKFNPIAKITLGPFSPLSLPDSLHHTLFGLLYLYQLDVLDFTEFHQDSEAASHDDVQVFGQITLGYDLLLVNIEP